MDTEDTVNMTALAVLAIDANKKIEQIRRFPCDRALRFYTLSKIHSELSQAMAQTFPEPEPPGVPT